jgi:hypothetical protein
MTIACPCVSLQRCDHQSAQVDDSLPKPNSTAVIVSEIHSPSSSGTDLPSGKSSICSITAVKSLTLLLEGPNRLFDIAELCVPSAVRHHASMVTLAVMYRSAEGTQRLPDMTLCICSALFDVLTLNDERCCSNVILRRPVGSRRHRSGGGDCVGNGSLVYWEKESAKTTCRSQT